MSCLENKLLVFLCLSGSKVNKLLLLKYFLCQSQELQNKTQASLRNSLSHVFLDE